MYMYVRITTPQRSLNGVDTAERADIHGVPPDVSTAASQYLNAPFVHLVCQFADFRTALHALVMTTLSQQAIYNKQPRCDSL